MLSQIVMALVQLVVLFVITYGLYNGTIDYLRGRRIQNIPRKPKVPNTPTLKNKRELWILDSQIREIGYKSRALVSNYFVVGTGTLVFIIILLTAPYFAPASVPQVFFTGATIEAAIGFHIYSIGNTVYSISESMDELGYFGDAKKMSANATLIVASAGSLAVLGVLYQFPWPEVPFFEIATVTVGCVLAIHGLLFIPGMVLHGDYHTWASQTGDGEQGEGIKQRAEAQEDEISESIDSIRNELVEVKEELDEMKHEMQGEHDDS